VSAKDMVNQWQQTVKFNLLSTLHAHQANALGLLSWTMALAGNCCAGAIAPLAPAGDTKPASVRRRMERLLANERLDALAAMLQLTRSILRHWGGRKLLLILDETPKANHLRCMRLSVAYHKRTVTLLSVCYPPDRPPMPMPKLVRWILREVAGCLPEEVTVTLLADRGLCWPTLIRQCRRLKWHYLLRLQCDTRVRLPDGSEKPASQLVERRDTCFFGQDVRIFKKARWLRANVVAVWEPQAKEPWLLVTDTNASYACCRNYCKRTWCEESHRDEKSHGLNWQRSGVNDPDHAQRLVLLMALASLLCIATGAIAIKRGLRRRLFEPRLRRINSVFQLGRHCLEYALIHEQPLTPIPALPPP
jgi:DDE family transposase